MVGGEKRELRFASRSSSNCQAEAPCAVLAIDLDGFRGVNEAYGHLAASRVLVEAARLLERCVRDCDLVGRTGGDEYAIVLMASRAEQAKAVAERIRRVFSAHL